MRVSKRPMAMAGSQKWICAALLTAGGVVIGQAGCSTSDCAFDATCGEAVAPPDAGPPDSGVHWPVNCDGEEPRQDSDRACLVEELGVFVSRRGNDVGGNDLGSKVNPFRTIGKALTALTSTRFRIYVCDGDYSGNLEFDGTRSGVEIYGGLACEDWHYSGEHAKLNGTDPKDPAVKWTGATRIKVRDLDITALDATADGGSSIAVLAVESEIDFLRVKLSAGKGKAGAVGKLVLFPYQTTGLQGKNGTTTGGGEATTVNCQEGLTSVGGKGGALNGDGAQGAPKLAGGAAGTSAACAASNTGGGNGVAGPVGKNGDGATRVGQLTAQGWFGASGASGTPGSPGQGGGGGGSGGGGGGGAGGCGGTGGPGGQAGGSSIALASENSRLTITDCELAASEGANGGKGATGQDGQTDFGAGGDRAGTGCNGGRGGAGGNGGGGGGGAGGLSVGILSTGRGPTTDGLTDDRITVKQFGAAGAGAISGNAGIPGIAEKKYPLPAQ